MTYNEIRDKIISLGFKGERISEAEAKEYLGEEICSIIDSMYDFCRKFRYNIFSHGAINNEEQVYSMFREGFNFSTSSISADDFLEKTGVKNVEEQMKNGKIGEVVDDEYVEYRVKLKNGNDYNIFSFDSMGQKFCRGLISYSEIISRFVAHYNNIPCNLMYFVLTPEAIRSSEDIQDKRYVAEMRDGWDDIEFDYYENEIIPTETIALCIDVEMRKVYLNEHFDCLYLLSNRSLIRDMITEKNDILSHEFIGKFVSENVFKTKLLEETNGGIFKDDRRHLGLMNENKNSYSDEEYETDTTEEVPSINIIETDDDDWEL